MKNLEKVMSKNHYKERFGFNFLKWRVVLGYCEECGYLIYIKLKA